MTALTAASSIPSGGGRDSWCALAARRTPDAVGCAHPHEKAMLFRLTPIAANLRISLYLTMLFPFSRRPSTPLGAKVILEKERPAMRALGHRRSVE